MAAAELLSAAAFNALLGPRGWVNLGLMEIFDLALPPVQFSQTLTAILAAHVFYNTAIVLRLVGRDFLSWRETLFLVASKSGTTIETRSQYRFFRFALGAAGAWAFRLGRADARAVIIEGGMQNSGLALGIIGAQFGGDIGMVIVASLWGMWHIVSGLSLAIHWRHGDARSVA